MIKKEVSIVNEGGIHARPAAQIAQMVGKFDASLTLIYKGERASAESPLEILMLQASQGAVITLEAQGPQADDLIKAICDLVEKGFKEES